MLLKIIESLGCHSIKEYATEYRAALPNKSNSTALCVKKDNALCAIRTSEGERYGDIYWLVMTLKNLTFGKAVAYIHKLFGLKNTYTKTAKLEKVYDPLEVFKKVKRKKVIVNNPLDVYDDSILQDYVPLPHISWVREGILPSACKRFNIGYSFDKKRIVIPERLWCGDDNTYVGIMGRTTVPNYDVFDIPKYYPLKKYNKGSNVYGLNENYAGIQEAGYVVVYESQKSVLKRYSRKDYTGVSIGSSTITDTQASILIGLNVDIVICLDEGISLEHIKAQCEKFYHVRRVYYVYDKWGLLDKKESPADKENKVFSFMLKYKVEYDEKERRDYLTGKEKQR